MLIVIFWGEYSLKCVTARSFYGEILGLPEGRRSEEKWQDYSLNGHQIVCHYVGENYRCPDFYNPVDGDEVYWTHRLFPFILTIDVFEGSRSSLWSRARGTTIS